MTTLIPPPTIEALEEVINGTKFIWKFPTESYLPHMEPEDTGDRITSYELHTNSDEPGPLNIWLTKLGQSLAAHVGGMGAANRANLVDPFYRTFQYSSGATYKLSALPAGFVLMTHVTRYKDGSRQNRRDAYCFAYTLQPVRYRSPNELLPHLLWILEGMGDYSKCTCKYCLPKVKECLSDMDALLPVYRIGELGWIRCNVGLTRVKSKEAISFKIQLNHTADSIVTPGDNTPERRKSAIDLTALATLAETANALQASDNDGSSTFIPPPLSEIHHWPCRIASLGLTWHCTDPTGSASIPTSQRWSISLHYKIDCLGLQMSQVRHQRFNTIAPESFLPGLTVPIPLPAVTEKMLNSTGLKASADDQQKLSVRREVWRFYQLALAEFSALKSRATVDTTSVWWGWEKIVLGDLVRLRSGEYLLVDELDVSAPDGIADIRVESLRPVGSSPAPSEPASGDAKATTERNVMDRIVAVGKRYKLVAQQGRWSYVLENKSQRIPAREILGRAYETFPALTGAMFSINKA